MGKLTILEWDEMNSTAIANVATSVASASATDHVDLAQAGNNVQNHIFNFFIGTDPDTVDEQSADVFMEISLKWEKQAETAGLPQTIVVQLKQNRDARLQGATTRGEKIRCWSRYAAELGAALNNWLGFAKLFFGGGPTPPP